MKEILFLSPIFKYRIWGKDKLKTYYPMIQDDTIGEAWIISAHDNGPSTILNGIYKGQTLNDVYKANKTLFGNLNADYFPLLVKMIDAHDRLSVQVHPDDDMASKFNSYGKTECWYILDADEGDEIIYGHTAHSKEEFRNLLDSGKYEELLIRQPVKKGDFFFIPAGMVHAIGKGILILEIQQSSDITYRLYDYDRIEKDGKKRELHLDLGLEATKFPSLTVYNKISSVVDNDNQVITLIEYRYFNVYKWNLKNQFKISNDPFSLLTFIDGVGSINGYPYKKGDSLIVPSTIKEIEINPVSFTEVVVAKLP